jgi:hypothetical protein
MCCVLHFQDIVKFGVGGERTRLGQEVRRRYCKHLTPQWSRPSGQKRMQEGCKYYARINRNDPGNEETQGPFNSYKEAQTALTLMKGL